MIGIIVILILVNFMQIIFRKDFYLIRLNLKKNKLYESYKEYVKNKNTGSLITYV